MQSILSTAEFQTAVVYASLRTLASFSRINEKGALQIYIIIIIIIK